MEMEKPSPSARLMLIGDGFSFGEMEVNCSVYLNSSIFLRITYILMRETMMLRTKMKIVENTISKFFPECLGAVKVSLAVCGISTFSDNIFPPALIFSGASGSGKTLPISFLFPDDDHKNLEKYIYRSDKFTPRSFVSHAANIKKNDLKNIDLLPRIKDKVFLTKELAPIFRGKKEEVQDTFSILISVLDGKGYISDSGSRGRRGYSEPIKFCWIGATTPLTNQVHELMSHLGTRLCFYSTDRKDKSIGELVIFAQEENQDEKEIRCRKVVNEFLVELFTQHPPESFKSTQIQFSNDFLRELVVATKAMAMLRSSFNEDKGIRKESEERAIVVLKNIARGSALIHGRNSVNAYDIKQIKHICLSTMPQSREKVLRALLKKGGRCSTTDVVNLTGMSQPYARDTMYLISRLGICDFTPGSQKHAVEITLKNEFHDLL